MAKNMKKLLSLLMALVMIVTLLPFEVFAVMLPMEDNSQQPSQTPGQESGSGSSSGDETYLLREDTIIITHPTHLTTGEVNITKPINPAAGKLSYKKESAL